MISLSELFLAQKASHDFYNFFYKCVKILLVLLIINSISFDINLNYFLNLNIY